MRKQSTYITDNISIQGYSHKLINKECQDSSLSWQEKDYCGIIVCDGHGGEKYIRSALGSKAACEVGQEKISEFMGKVGKSTHKLEDNLVRLEYSIVSAWREKIEADFSEHPIDSDERFESLEESDKASLLKNPVKAYGSTFIAGVIAKDFCFVLKLGDGNAMLFYSDSTAEMPEELVDEDLQFNVTTSLCNSDAAVSFRHCYKQFSEENRVVGITLTSDGVINCYHTEEAYRGFMENVFAAYGEDEAEAARSELIEALDILSEKGSGDDLSVSIVRLRDFDFAPVKPVEIPEAAADTPELAKEMAAYEEFQRRYSESISIDKDPEQRDDTE